MAYTTIDKPTDYFDSVLYTGDGSGNRDISGLDFQPDWVWIKDRANPGTTWHHLFDSTRGANKPLNSNVANAEGSVSTFPAFNSDGFRVNAGNLNTDTQTNVAWCWKANGGTTTTNDASATSIGDQDSVHQANTTSGFSIVTWSGSNGNNTMAHGLGAVPNVIIMKSRSAAEAWGVYHHKNTSAPETDFLRLDTTAATSDSPDLMNDTAPTSTVFTVGDSGTANETGKTYVAYCFAEKQGYSKFGSYKGNGNANGPFIYTGFKPAWVLRKRTDDAQQWQLYDNKRPGIGNGDMHELYVDSNDAEAGSNGIDFLSNGFKVRVSNGGMNTSDANHVYMAFAESPFVSSKGVPTTAR